MIFENPGFDEDDKIGLQLENAVFKPFHAGLVIKNFRIVTDYDDPGTTHAIFEPYRADHRTVGMIDVDMRMQGSVLRAITTAFNWRMENIILETQYLYRLVLARLSCGEDNTDMGTKTHFKNVTTINSGGKPSYLHSGESFLRMYFANDILFEDCHFDTYLGYKRVIGQFIMYNDPTNCSPLVSKNWNFTNVLVTTSRLEDGKDPSFIESNVWAFVREEPIDPILNIYMNNFTFSNDINDWLGRIFILASHRTSIKANGLNYINSDGYMFNGPLHDIEILNSTYENITANTPYLSYITAEEDITFDGITLKNVTDSGGQVTSLFHNDINQGNSFIVRNINVYDSQFLDRRAVFLVSASSESQLLVENIYTQNVILNGDTPLIAYGIFKNVSINNIY